MRHNYLFAAMALALSLTGCRQQPASSASQEAWIDHAEEVATYQLLSTAATIFISSRLSVNLLFFICHTYRQAN